jgi:multidrug resistance efflux pump
MSDRNESERLARAQRQTLEAMQARVEQMTRQTAFTEAQLKQPKIEAERYAEMQADMARSMREQAARLAATARVDALTSALADLRYEIEGWAAG